MPVQLVARVDVGDVHLHDDALKRLDGVDDGDRGEGIGGRIDDDGVRASARLLDQVDQLALVVRLVKGQRQRKPRGGLLAALLDLRQRGRAIDMRLAHAEQIEIGSVQNYDAFHEKPVAQGRAVSEIALGWALSNLPQIYYRRIS